MKPILFNTEMVRAILEGRKTVTRRVVKIPSNIQLQDNGLYTLHTEGTCYENQDIEDLIVYYLKSPYELNDILYVRETWHKYIKRVGKGEQCHLQEFYGYKASIANSEDANEKWRPSIHMPREAARIFLRVKSVRVERLQDMTKEDMLKEGIIDHCKDCKATFGCDLCINEGVTVEDEFWSLWTRTIKKDQLKTYGWYANPYVWVIEFEVISKEAAVQEV